MKRYVVNVKDTAQVQSQENLQIYRGNLQILRSPQSLQQGWNTTSWDTIMFFFQLQMPIGYKTEANSNS